MNAITLTAIARPPETDQGNLFVRLTPRTAWRLARMIHAEGEEPLLFEEECVVEFLPLEITLQLHHKGENVMADDDAIVTIYASYNGGAPAPFVCPSPLHHYGGQDEDVIELPLDLHPSLATEFNIITEPIRVSVRPLSDVPVAEEVTFEPLSTSDWELIEMEASALEDGGLLNQITIVYPGQVLPLRFPSPGESLRSGGLESAAWIKVVAQDGFDSSSVQNDFNETDSMYSSDTDSSQPTHYDMSYNCIRLMAETEVSVIPKPRLKNEDDNEPTEEKESTKPDDLVYAHSCPLRVQSTSSIIPAIGCVYVHPSTLQHLPGYQQIFKRELLRLENGSDLPSAVVSLRKWDSKYCIEESEACTVARISASNSVREGHITLHDCLLRQLGAAHSSDRVCAQVWSQSHVIDSIHQSRDEIANGKVTIELTSISSKMPYVEDRISFTSCEAFTITPDALINSGSIISAATLQSLVPRDKNWLDQYCLFSVNLQRTDGDKPVEVASRLGSIITGHDLKDFLERKGQIKDNQFSVDDKIKTLPSVNAYVEGFSSIIDRLVHGVNKMISVTTRRNAILLTGEIGSGKTHLACALASRLSLSHSIGMVYLDCKMLQAAPGNSLSSILNETKSACQEAIQNQPSLLILDDLDAIIPNFESSDGGDGSIHHQQTNPALVNQVKTVVDHLLCYSRQCGNSNVIILCTCRDDDSIASRYKNSGIFYTSVGVPSLNSHERTRFLYHYALGDRLEEEGESIHDVPSCIAKLGKMSDGFRPHDLKLLAARIRHSQYLRQIESSSEEREPNDEFTLEHQNISLDVLNSDVASAIKDFTPLSQQSVDISQNKCNVDWSSVGGLKRAKQSLYEVIIHPMNFKAIYDNSPASLPTGVLLYGPPGSGKSFLVPALAKASNLSLITCRGPELLDRYIGASEAKVRQHFAQAITAAPSLIFFDEFDSLAPQRGSDHTGVTDRVVNQLLTLLDGAERNKKTSQIYVVAATSRPDKIDKALLRPGRLETHVYVGYPDSLMEWEELFASILSSWNVDEEVRSLQEKGKLYSTMCTNLAYAEDLSAADMKAVMDTAHLMRVHEILDEDVWGRGPENEMPSKVIIGKRHLMEAFKRTRPSLLPEDKLKLLRYYQPFYSDKNSPPGHDKDTHVLNHNLKTSFR